MDKQETSRDGSGLQERILEDTTALLYKAIPGSVIATIIIATILTSVIWQFFENLLLVLWLSSLSIINIARFVMYKYYIRYKSHRSASYWDTSFYLLLILNGLCFSVVGLVFLPEASSTYHYFPIMVLIGLATGAVSSLSFNLRNITTYFILLLAPVLISEIVINTFLSISISALILLSMVFSLVNAKRINQTAIENITLNYQSEKQTQQLIESRNTAIAANSAKTNFVSMISHELRTPLNGMLGFSQLLAMSDSPPLNKEQQESNKGIHDSGKHLLSLIEELLDLSEIESHKLSVVIEDVSLADNISESVLMLNPVAKGFDIEIINNVENIYLARADLKRLKQVFINIISNAIKYNHENGKVIISALGVAENKVRVSISDTGTGLTNEQIKGLFKPFQRFDNSKEGLGLGLYITQNLVELMDGKIGVESKQGKGSTFWFELPLSE